MSCGGGTFLWRQFRDKTRNRKYTAMMLLLLKAKAFKVAENKVTQCLDSPLSEAFMLWARGHTDEVRQV